MADVWAELRLNEFPVARRWAYLDHAAVAPLPRRSGDVLRAWTLEQEENGVVNWPAWGDKVEAIRDRVASLLNADRDEIAFVNSTTQGIGLIAEGFPWRNGDSVVIPAEEYPSNIYPWMNLSGRGVSVRLVPSRTGRIWPEDLIEAMDQTTRVLAISHVEFASGFRNDLDRSCRNLPGSRDCLVRGRDSGIGPAGDRRPQDADRLPRGRWAQMAARSGGGRSALHTSRLD